MRTKTAFLLECCIVFIGCNQILGNDGVYVPQQSNGGNGVATIGGHGGATTVTSGSGGAATSGDEFGGFDPGAGGSGGTGGGSCIDSPPQVAGAEAVLAADYANMYKLYDLGPIPGAPLGHLGGAVLRYDDPNTLLFGSNSENATGTIYSVGLERGPCGHIVGFNGLASKVADAPYVDANLVYGPNSVLFFTRYPENKISQILPEQTQADLTLDGPAIGINTGDSVSGFGFVPPWLAAAGEPRTITYGGGHWYQLTLTTAGPLFNLSNALEKAALPGGPGGFAYIPKGSPGFPKPSIILSEWSADTVATYEVDEMGDPIVGTRKDFLSSFPKPWGAYFESKTGDFLFLTWGSLPDHVYVAQGFAVPPPPPLPPK